MRPPPIADYHVANFKTLFKAIENDAVALVSAIRKADQKPVALICDMGRDEEGNYYPTPLAVMVEGNPFELFEDPMEDA